MCYWCHKLKYNTKAISHKSVNCYDPRNSYSKNYKNFSQEWFIIFAIENKYLVNKLKLTAGENSCVTYQKMNFQKLYFTDIFVSKCDTINAMLKYGGDCIGLNFANEHHVGGGYLNGAFAQEEDLCRRCPELYMALDNAKKVNNFYPLKPGKVIITRDVGILRNDDYSIINGQKFLHFMTAAMPNLNNIKFKSMNDYIKYISIIIKSVLHAAAINNFRYLVLGAFGCGAFKNNPKIIASLFKNIIESDFPNVFEKIEFAILCPKSSDNKNFLEFKNVFK